MDLSGSCVCNCIEPAGAPDCSRGPGSTGRTLRTGKDGDIQLPDFLRTIDVLTITDEAPVQYPGRTPVLTRLAPDDSWNGPTVGAVLALHGGRVRGRRAVGRLDLPMLRMYAIARSLADRLAPDGIAVWMLRYAVQGWNGADASPVADARWALRQVASHADVPVAIVGHSMGGRTALRVAGASNVAGVVALAPWIPPGEPMGDLAGRRLIIGHGTADRTTDPRASRAYASDAWGVASEVRCVDVPGEGHALLRKPGWWNEFAADSAREVLASTTALS